MPPHAHHVDRLILDCEIADMDEAMALRARIEDLARDRLPAAMERVFDQLAPTDLDVRLQRLQIDIGRIAPDRLEADLPAALEAALAKALNEAIADARSAAAVGASSAAGDRALTQTAAAIEDLGDWLTYGAPRRPGAVRFDPAAALGRLIGATPSPLVAALRARREDRPAMMRLVLQAGADNLRALVGLLSPSDAAVILQWMAEVARLYPQTPAPPLPEPELDRSLWLLTLDHLLRDAGSGFNRRSYAAFLLRGLAAAQGVEFSALLGMLRAALAPVRRRRPVAGSLPAMIDDLALEAPEPAARVAPPADAIALAQGGDLTALLALLRAAAGDPLALGGLTARLSASVFAAAVSRLEPVHAAAILAYVAGLGALHQSRDLVALSQAGLGQALRVLTLRYLLRDAGSQFNRRSWLQRLLRGLAAAGGVAYPTLLTAMADALAKLRDQMPVGSSLPAAVAALADDLPPTPNPGPAKARGGRSGDAAALGGLLVRSTAAEAADIRASLADLIRIHRRLRLTALSDTAFAELLRVRTAAYLAAPGAFDREAWLRGLLEAVAAAAQPTPMLRLLIGAPTRVLRVLAAGDDAATAAALATAGAKAAEAIQADLDLLGDLYAEGGVSSLDAAGFRRMVVSLALVELARQGRFSRAALRRALATGLNLSQEVWARHTQPGVALADPLGAAELYLRQGDAELGAQLAAIAAADPQGLAALVRRLARARPGGSRALIDRLLEWLSPEELAEVLAPGQGATAWALLLAAGEAGDLGTAWLHVLEAVLEGRVPPNQAPPPAGLRMDRETLLRLWLDTGALAWWAPPGLRLDDLLSSLIGRSDPALATLLADPDADRVALRLTRLIATLGPARGDTLLQRLAGAKLSDADWFKHAIAGISADRRPPYFLRAVAGELAGTASRTPSRHRDLGRPLPDVGAPGSEEALRAAPPPAQAELRPALFAWLSGEGDPRPWGLARLVRFLAELADAGDAELEVLLRRALASEVARRRWAELPEEAFIRLLHVLAPRVTPWLSDLIDALRRARDGLAARTLASLRAAALAALAEEVEPSPRRLADLLVRALEPEAGAASALRAAALDAARSGGHRHLLALLQPVATTRKRPSAAAARPPEPTRPPVAPSAPAEGETHYVGNAGLVLFNPFLPRFFEQLGVLTTGPEGVRIEGAEAISRAVHLLQYLADERCDTPEPALALNKLICGLPLATPVARSIEPTEADLALCASLTAAVIANWSVISSSSPAALRETFVQREGRLRRSDDLWTLMVERKTVDVLADQMPWNRSIVFHAWMTEPLHVTW